MEMNYVSRQDEIMRQPTLCAIIHTVVLTIASGPSRLQHVLKNGNGNEWTMYDGEIWLDEEGGVKSGIGVAFETFTKWYTLSFSVDLF